MAANDPQKAKQQIDKVAGPKSEQARTRDVTPSVEKPGEKPTRPDRPQS